jgi:hypothetical protein
MNPVAEHLSKPLKHRSLKITPKLKNPDAL